MLGIPNVLNFVASTFIPAELRILTTRLPSPVKEILGFAQISAQPLSRDDFFRPDFRGTRFVIKSNVRFENVYEGNFVRVEQDPGIADHCEGYTDIVATIENPEQITSFKCNPSLATSWDDDNVYLDLDKLFGNGPYRCYAV